MEKEEETIRFDPKMEIPLYFRCPISMEVMLEPVTISTGVTYEKKNIEKWFYTYKKKTCPATMQSLNDFHLTPNHNLKRLILSWKESDSSKSSLLILPAVSVKHDELLSVLATIETTPFVVSSLKKLRSIVEISDETKLDFVKSGGIQVLSRIIVQILLDCGDFVVFRACEEALYILHLVPLLSDEKSMELLSKPECMKAMAIMLQRGSAEARLHTITIFRKMAKTEYNWSWVVLDQGMELFTSLFELVSDEINNKASSSALDVLIEILRASKKNQLKAIEAGAMLTLIDLLPDSNKSKCERMLLIIKILCDCAEGRLALIDHSLGIVAISKKILRVSDLATRLGVKIIWSITTSHPLEKVLEEMLVYGSVRKLLGLLHIDGPSSTKDRALKIIKLHGNTWRKYPCFPSELRDYLVLKNDLN